MLKIWKSVPEFSTSLSNLPDVMIKINFRVPNTREDWNTRRMSEYDKRGREYFRRHVMELSKLEFSENIHNRREVLEQECPWWKWLRNKIIIVSGKAFIRNLGV